MTTKQGGALHPLPIKTFGDIAALGLEVQISCTRCYRKTKVDPAADALWDRPFASTVFRCTGTRDMGFAHPSQPCHGIGHIRVHAPVLLPVGGAITLAFLSCRTCAPVCWEIDQVQLDQPPWSLAKLGPNDRFRCPACRRPLSWHIHGPAWRPRYSHGSA